MDKKIIVLAGLPGTGKSTFAAKLVAEAEKAGKKIEFYNDYPVLIELAKKYRGDETKVRWFKQEDGTENFDIVPEAYREISASIATNIAEKMRNELEDFDMVVIESARGAGPDGRRDRYDEELFKPLMFVLQDSGAYINIEMVVSDIAEIRRRMIERSREDSMATPEFILDKYLSPSEGIQSAREAAERVGGFALNREIDNSGNPEDAEIVMLGIIGEIFALTHRESLTEGKTNPEGVRTNPESE
jgi:hypothetical protein